MFGLLTRMSLLVPVFFMGDTGVCIDWHCSCRVGLPHGGDAEISRDDKRRGVKTFVAMVRLIDSNRRARRNVVLTGCLIWVSVVLNIILIE